MPEREANLQAAYRVARRAKLSDVFVSSINAKRLSDSVIDGAAIKPQFSDEYEVVSQEENRLCIRCRHRLEATMDDSNIAEILIDLNLIYDLVAGEPIDDADLREFANANGAYNSWPFVREAYQSLTLRLGLPGYVLPTLLLVTPKPTASKAAESSDEQAKK